MNMKSAAIDDLLNDGSSKVWLINKVIFSGINTVESSLYQKQIMVFHSSQNIDIIQLNSIGKKNAKKGDFNIDPAITTTAAKKHPRPIKLPEIPY